MSYNTPTKAQTKGIHVLIVIEPALYIASIINPTTDPPIVAMNNPDVR